MPFWLKHPPPKVVPIRKSSPTHPYAVEGGAKGLDYKPAGRHAGEALPQHFAKVLTVGWVVAKVVSMVLPQIMAR